MVIKIMFWWAVLGFIPYQLIVLRKMKRDHKLVLSDIIKSIPFGLVAFLAVLITKLFISKEKQSGKENHSI